MKKFTIIFTTLLLCLTFIPNFSFAQEKTIKFDNETFTLKSSEHNPSTYKYVPKGDEKDEFHQMILLQNFPDITNPIEEAANVGHKIQEQNPQAAVIIYPDLGMIEFINFPQERNYYEYNALQYIESPIKGVDLYQYKKRFYSKELDGAENARKQAIEFAQQGSSKTMEFVNEITTKYKID